jgi:hypothetical protein
MVNRPLPLTRAVMVSLCHLNRAKRSGGNPKTDFSETGDWIMRLSDILGQKPRSIVLMISVASMAFDYGGQEIGTDCKGVVSDDQTKLIFEIGASSELLLKRAD